VLAIDVRGSVRGLDEIDSDLLVSKPARVTSAG
jgi:hypothetical protein